MASDGFEDIVSSNLAEAKFEAKGGTAEGVIIVRFQNGTAYEYPNCSEKLWTDFRSQFDGKQGRSAGRFLAAQLKPRAYKKLDDWK